MEMQESEKNQAKLAIIGTIHLPDPFDEENGQAGNPTE